MVWNEQRLGGSTTIDRWKRSKEACRTYAQVDSIVAKAYCILQEQYVLTNHSKTKRGENKL